MNVVPDLPVMRLGAEGMVRWPGRRRASYRSLYSASTGPGLRSQDQTRFRNGEREELCG